MKKIIFTFTSVLIAFIISCDLLVDNNDDPGSFGMEEGYFYWLDEEKVWLKRDRDHLSIRFYEEYGEAHHDSVLKEYGIEIVWSQTFGKKMPMPGYYRVIEKPAEEYYTTYGDTEQERLGNLPEVEYVLPVFWLNEQFWDLKLTPVILYTFHDHISKSRQEEILDSLRAADNIEIFQRSPGEDWSPYNIYVTKDSPKDPYTLYHRYYDTNFFKSIDMNWSYTTRWNVD